MSYLYDQYLTNHKSNVKKGFDWIRDNLPELINQDFDLEHQICFAHDQSKTKQDEYDAYDAYFYGGIDPTLSFKSLKKLGFYTFIVIHIIGNIGF